MIAKRKIITFLIVLIGLPLLAFLITVALESWWFARFPSRAFSEGLLSNVKIYNVHEHFQSLQEVPKFLQAMKRNQITQTVALGSPEATIFSGKKGFDHEDENNEEILRIAQKYPDQIIAFPTLDPQDPEKLEKLKRYVQAGARGLKLYSGHTFFHQVPLDEASMLPVYQFCEEKELPIIFHVNVGYYQYEFESVLKKFPNLKVICPHFCLSTINTDRFQQLMRLYPQLYTDLSFGYVEFLKEALTRFSQEPERYRKIIEKYQDRILFGTDMVVTNAGYKTEEWLSLMTRTYRSMLEKEFYESMLFPYQTVRGLHLSPEVLKKIYQTNFETLLAKKKTA